MTTPPNAVGMIGARRRDSDTKRARVLATLERMLGEGMPITFASVARQAKVSTWLVYAPGIRDAITESSARQHNQNATEPRHPTNTRGLQTDLALARAEITTLRAERDQHRQQLRLALGTRMDNIAKADLLTRVEELTHDNDELTAALAQHRRDNETLHTRVTELEDDLAAARTSLRRMIRADNLPPDIS